MCERVVCVIRVYMAIAAGISIISSILYVLHPIYRLSFGILLSLIIINMTSMFTGLLFLKDSNWTGAYSATGFVLYD